MLIRDSSHIEAPDEASHQADYKTKVESIEAIDRYIVGPVLKKLQTFPEWRILVLPDHPTNISTRKHGYAPTCFAMAGTRVKGILPAAYSEKNAAASDLRRDIYGRGVTRVTARLSELYPTMVDGPLWRMYHEVMARGLPGELKDFRYEEKRAGVVSDSTFDVSVNRVLGGLLVWWQRLDEDRRRLDSSREGMLEGFSLGSYLLLVDYTGRLFRAGKAAISREVAEVFERLGSSAENWQARLEKLSKGRLFGRFFAASRQRLREVFSSPS